VRKIFRHGAALFLTAGITSVFAVKAWADILVRPGPMERITTVPKRVFIVLFLFSILIFCVLMIYKNHDSPRLQEKNVSARQQNSIYSWLWLFILFWALCLIVFGCLLLLRLW
jgi:hypothetical protein